MYIRKNKKLDINYSTTRLFKNLTFLLSMKRNSTLNTTDALSAFFPNYNAEESMEHET